MSAESPAVLLLPLGAEPLSLRLGGKDVHLVFRTALLLRSELLVHGSDAQLRDFGFKGPEFS